MKRYAWMYGLLFLITAMWPSLVQAAPQVIEAFVRVPPSMEPSLYLRFRNNKMWMATTKEGLEKATPIKAGSVSQDKQVEEGYEYRYYNFPEVDVPVPLPGVEKVSATFYTSREIHTGPDYPKDLPADQTRVVASFTLTRKDSSDTGWIYTLHCMGDYPTDKPPVTGVELWLPALDPDQLKMEITTKVEEKNARIGLKVKSGDADIDNILKGDTNAEATLTILNLDGKVVSSEKGDLEKFGFT